MPYASIKDAGGSAMKAGDGFKARVDGGGRAAFTTADATAVSALSSRQVMQQAKLKRTTLSVQIAFASSEDGPAPWTGGDGRMAQGRRSNTLNRPQALGGDGWSLDCCRKG